MLSYIELAFAWLLFLSIPALAAGMFYRAWKTRRQKTDVRNARSDGFLLLSRPGASCFAVINVACGLALSSIFAAILIYGLEFAAWSGSTALIVWIYSIATYLLARMEPVNAKAP